MPPSLESAEHPCCLVVSHDFNVRSTVKSVLTTFGFSVVEAQDGLHASSLVQAKPCFDLLVTETQSPGLDGRTLAESFMFSCRLGRVVMMSPEEDVDAINSESNGAWTFVSKGRLADTLLDSVRRIGLAHSQRVILVAEDEPAIRDLLEKILTQAGYAVIAAADGQEALELSRAYTGNIDLLISDTNMPRMTGPELADHIFGERPKTQVLLMSSNTSTRLVEFAAKHDFLNKPFAPTKFIEIVNALLTRPKTAAGSSL